MKCFKYTINSDNSTNGLHKVNSQQNHELTKLLNDGKKYRIVVSKFYVLGTEFDTTNEINRFYITVQFLNINFINSFVSDEIDNVVVKTTGSLQERSTGKYLLTCEETFNVMENNTGMYSGDRIIENGQLNIQVLYYDSINGDFIQPNSSIWSLEFYIIFD